MKCGESLFRGASGSAQTLGSGQAVHVQIDFFFAGSINEQQRDVQTSFGVNFLG